VVAYLDRRQNEYNNCGRSHLRRADISIAYLIEVASPRRINMQATPIFAMVQHHTANLTRLTAARELEDARLLGHVDYKQTNRNRLVMFVGPSPIASAMKIVAVWIRLLGKWRKTPPRESRRHACWPRLAVCQRPHASRTRLSRVILTVRECVSRIASCSWPPMVRLRRIDVRDSGANTADTSSCRT